ncbi:WhiB family transcriptional regulator [Kribbella sp. GL6]|uniref:WhiB family transcriptional regulator n=1 Tax=Kribbella sp. GL6 TaxID=3419765 RepID=UPI003D072AAC
MQAQSTALDTLYPPLTAVGTPPPSGSCARLAGDFTDQATQQAVFDGDVDAPALVAAARRVCATCPVLRECRTYAEDSLDQFTFLAGRSAEERATGRRRATTTQHRRTIVGRMRAAGISSKEISFYTSYPLRSVEGDAAHLATAKAG